MSAEGLGFAPSEFVKVAIGDQPIERLVLVFSHVEEPAGRFTFERRAAQLGWNAILLNVPDRSYYLRGIPGLGPDLGAVVAALRAAIARLAPAQVCALGISMGGFGAALFGAALKVDRVLAIGAETELLLRGSRSRGFIADRFKPAVGDLRPAIAAARDTRFTFVWGETDVIDAHAAARVADLPNVTALPVRNGGHEIGRWLSSRNRLVEFLAAFVAGAPKLEDFLELGDSLRDPATIPALHRGNDALLRFKPREAVGPLLAAIGACPGYATAHHCLARAYAQLGRHDAALRAHQRALALDPETPLLRIGFAETLAGAGRLAESENVLRAVGEAHPKSAAAHHALAQVLARRGDASGAELACSRALGIEPRNALFLATQAALLVAQSRWAEAVSALRCAVEINPLRGELFLQLGVALARLGQGDEARAALGRAVELEPANPEMRRLAEAALNPPPPATHRDGARRHERGAKPGLSR